MVHKTEIQFYMTTDRQNNTITDLKGMAIILMVLGHSGCNILSLMPYNYMFHMPLFFILSGYCLMGKISKLTISRCPIWLLQSLQHGAWKVSLTNGTVSLTG